MAKKPTPKPDPKDWTNSPSSMKWAKYYGSKVNADGSAKKAALAKKIASTKKSDPRIPTSPTH